MNNSRNTWKALIILLAALAITISYAIYVERNVEARSKLEFTLVCNEIKTKISLRLQGHAQLLRTGSAYFAASDSVTRSEWKAFNTHARIEENLPGIQGIGFSLIIPKNELQYHIKVIRQEGFPDYTVRPAGNREFYTSIIYLEPFSGRNLRAFGYDMYSEPIRRSAMEQARDFDVAALSGKVTLVQETDKDLQTGTLMYVPVYRNGKPLNTVEERRAAIFGWVYSPYRMNDLMTGILGRWDLHDLTRIHLQIYDNASMSAESLLFDSQQKNSLQRTDLPSRTITIPIVFNGKKWTLRFSQSDKQLPYLSGNVVLIFIGGIIISFLLFGLSLSLSKSSRKRQLAEKLTAELTESEAKFHHLFMNMAEGAALHKLILDDKGEPEDYVIVEINPAFEMSLGLTKDSVIGKTSKAAYGVADPPYLDIYAHVATTGEPITFESYFPPLERHFLISAYCPAEGTFATIFQNITERKNAEQLLRVSLTKYQVMFDSFPLGISVSDSDGKIIETNHIAEKLLGITEKEQEQRTISGKEWKIIRTDGTVMPPSEYASVRALSEGRQVENMEMGIVKDDNQVTWINVSAAPLPLEGYGVAITYNDITDQKRAEKALYEANAYLENLFNYANAPIIVWDPQFRVTRFNHAFEFLTGRSEAEVIGQPLNILFPPELVENSMEQIHKTVTGERWESVEIKIMHRDESVRTVLWNSATLFASDGLTPIATIAQGQNITRRKHAEEELQNLNETLEQRVAKRTRQLEISNKWLEFHLRETEQFTYIATHDLQEPLNTLNNFTRLIQEEYAGKLNDDGNKYIDFIRNSAARMSNLVKDLLEYSLLGKESELTTVDCNEIVDEVLADMDDAIQSSQALIAVKELPKLQAFATELRMLFQNLVNNAIKFQNKGIRPEINISAERMEKEWLFSIEDNGIGLDEKDREKIFIMFKRMQNRKDYEGTGIGLAHCKKIVELHGGRIWVESVKNAGSTFRFTIPFRY
jgi:PAS domain S-box-containing protein